MTYAPTPPPAPKKSNVGLIVGIILGVVLLACLGCAGAFYAAGWWATDKVDEIVENLPTGEVQVPAGSHVVRYEIEGTGRAWINWARGTGGQDSDTTDIPWSKEITVNADNFGVLVSAIGRGEGSEVKSCRLLIDGVEKKRAEAKNGLAQCGFTFVGNP